ncbi:Cysteine protease atg4b [Haplosporangium gracile]|nr:Cysteine protease atg4b [Haplosporangium gracile]
MSHHTPSTATPASARPKNYYPQDAVVVSQQTAERVHAPTVAVSSSSSSTMPVAKSSSPHLVTSTTAPAAGTGSLPTTTKPARTKVQLSKAFRSPPVPVPSQISTAAPTFTPSSSRQPIKSAPPNSRDDLEFWASLYAQHPVITQQRHEPAALSPPRTTNKKGGPFVKIWQVLRKTHLKKRGDRSDHFRFETLAPEETPTTTTATKVSPSTSSFSVVIFFTVEEGEQKDNQQQKFGSGSRNSKRWLLPPTLQLWCVESARNRNRILFNQKELMGSFVPNALSFHPDSNGHDVTAPLYIYETQTLDLDAVSQEGPMVLELKLQSTEGAIYSDFFYLFVQETEGAAGVNSGKFIETTVITPRSQGIVEPRSLGRNGSAGGGSHSNEQRLVAGVHNNDSVESSIGSHENEHRKDPDEWDMTEDEVEGEEEGEEDDVEQDDFDEEKPIGGIKVKKRPPVEGRGGGGGGGGNGPVEPDAGEHLMQATSQFFSKMGYWLYNSRVVQYIARDERTRIKTAFQPENIWMLGICYSLQLQLENNSASVTPVVQEPVESEMQDHHDHTAIEDNTSVATILQGSTLVNGHSTISERPQPHRSMSLTKFATTTPDRSPATSSISCHEAQSHSHSRATTLDKVSDTAAPPSAATTFDQQPSGGNHLPSPATLPSTKRSSKLASRFSKLSLGSESSLAKEAARHGSSLDAGKGDTNEKTDSTKTDPTPTPPCPRKPGKRRMTISGLFSWDSSSSDSKISAPPIPALPTSSSSISVLKNLVRSSSTKLQQSSSTTTPSNSTKVSPQSTIFMEPESLEDDDFANVEYPPELTGRQPTSSSSGLRSILESPSVRVTSEAQAHETKKSSTPPPPPSPSLPARELEVPDGTAGPKRERRRKTSQMTMQRPTDLQCTDQQQQYPTTQGPPSVSENVPRTSHSSGRSNRRQSSMPPSTSIPTKGRPRTATSSIPSIPSASSSSLLPAALPASSNSGSSSGSAIRRSWRSLSLSLASAKLALPLVSSSSFSLRSPKLPSQFNEAMMRRDYGELGSEEDYFSNAFDVPGAVTLPPVATTSLALLRTTPSSTTSTLTPEQATLSLFMMDFQSRLWFTYRKDLARIEPSFYTCDSGWGCMMRTGQSLLAQAFVQVLMGREWRVHHHDQPQPTQRRQERHYKEIVSWFVDEAERPYSIHRIAKQGLALDKRIGEWFGPSTVAHALKRLTKSHSDCPVKVIVPMDGTVRVSAVLRAASSHSSYLSLSATSSTSPSPSPDSILRPTPASSQAWRPVLLLIPARYGLDRVTEKYLANLKKLFRMPQFLGIAGGRPNRSLYFVASQGDELFYYDPHFVKQRVTPEELGSCPMPSFHCPVVRTMHISELDPSMLLGFLIQSRDELDDLRIRLDRDMVEASYPLLTFVDNSGASASAS